MVGLGTQSLTAIYKRDAICGKHNQRMNIFLPNSWLLTPIFKTDAMRDRLRTLSFCPLCVKRSHPLGFMAVFATVRRLIRLVIQAEAVGIFHHKLHHLPMRFTSEELFEILFWTPVTHHDYFVGSTNSSFHLHAAFSFGSCTSNPRQISPHPEKSSAIACQHTIDKNHCLWTFWQIDLVNRIALCICHLQTPLQSCSLQSMYSIQILFT